MNNKRRFLCFLLLMTILLSLQLSSAVASTYTPQWKHIQRELDCQGQKIVIDAITDTNLPETVCEYKASLRVMTEEKLRAFVAVAAPGYENMPLVWPHAQGIDADHEWTLDDEEAGVSASPSIAFGLERYHETREKLSVGTLFGSSYIYRDSIDPATVTNLKDLSYPDALKLLEPVLAATELTLGEPQLVEVYDLSTLYSNQNQYNETFHEHHNYTWETGNEIYKIQYPVYFQELPLHTHGGLVIGDKSVAYTAMNIVLQADGTLLELHVDNIIDNPVAVGPDTKPLSLEQILDVFNQYVSSTLLPDNVDPRVRRISLEHLVKQQYTGAFPTYELIPVWCFYLPTTNPLTPENADCIQYFSAITGEYLMMY